MKRSVIFVATFLIFICLIGFVISEDLTKIADKEGIIKIGENEYNVKIGSKLISDNNGLKEGTTFVAGKNGGKYVLKGLNYNFPEKTKVLFKDGKVMITLPDGTSFENPEIIDNNLAKNSVFEINAEKGNIKLGKDNFDKTLSYEVDNEGKGHLYIKDKTASLGGLQITQKDNEKIELFFDGDKHSEVKDAYLSLGEKSLVIGKNSEGKGPEVKFNSENRFLDKINAEQYVAMNAGRDKDDKNSADSGTIKITNRGDTAPKVETDKSFKIDNGEIILIKALDSKGNKEIFVEINKNGKKSYATEIEDIALDDGNGNKYKYLIDSNNHAGMMPVNENPILLSDDIIKKINPINPIIGVNLDRDQKDPLSNERERLDNSLSVVSPSLPPKESLDVLTNKVINQYRGSSLNWDEDLAKDAYTWSKNMAANNHLYHAQGNFGENILYTYGSLIRGQMGSESPEAIANYFKNQWVNSPGHRANIVNPQYKTTGIGIYIQELSNGDKKYWATQRFKF